MMSSFHSSGFSRMKRAIRAMQSGSSAMITSTPRWRRRSGLPGKFVRLADHHARDAELEDGAGAHHAGRQRGVEGHPAIGLLPAGLAQAIHLAVGDRIALLDALVAPPRDEALALRQHAADRAAALVEAGQGLLVGHAQELGIGGAEIWHVEPAGSLRFGNQHRSGIVMPAKRTAERDADVTLHVRLDAHSLRLRNDDHRHCFQLQHSYNAVQ